MLGKAVSHYRAAERRDRNASAIAEVVGRNPTKKPASKLVPSAPKEER